MRLPKHAKPERNLALVDCAKAHPEKTLADLAQLFNITRQRVWQILKKNGAL